MLQDTEHQMDPFSTSEHRRADEEKVSFSNLGLNTIDVRVIEVECAKFAALVYNREQLKELTESGEATEYDPTPSDGRLTRTGVSRAAMFHEGGYDVLSFRGTDPTNVTDILTDLGSTTSRLSDEFPFVTDDLDLRVHAGFLSAVKVYYERVSDDIKTSGGPVFVCGHSMGAAVAFLFAYLYGCETGTFLPTITFGQPRVVYDDPQYSPYRVDDVFTDYHRYVNAGDVVTRMPFRADLGGYAANVQSAMSLATRVLAAAVSPIGYHVAGFVHVGPSTVLFGDNEHSTLTIGGVQFEPPEGKPFVSLPSGADVEESSSTSHYPSAMLEEHSIETYEKRLIAIGGGTLEQETIYVEEVDLTPYKIRPVDPNAPKQDDQSNDANDQHSSDIHHGHHLKKHYSVAIDPRVLGYILYDPADEASVVNHAVLFEC